MKRLLFIAPLVTASFVVGLTASGQTAGRVRVDSPVAIDRRVAVENSARLAEAVPQQVEAEQAVSGESGQPTRLESCSRSCEIVDGNRVTTEICRPFVERLSGITVAAMERRVERNTGVATATRPVDRGRAEVLVTPETSFRRLRDGAIELRYGETNTCVPSAQQTFYSQVVRAPKSPYCWVSAAAYCRYRPEGRVGYPCNCGGKPGYFD